MPGMIRTRKAGATTRIERGGHAEVTSATGGRIAIASRASEAGFSPLDLLHAALSACLAVSARVAAGELGFIDRFAGATVSVAGEKAGEGQDRIATFRLTMVIEGTLDAHEKAAIVTRAEELCTVSNTVKGAPAILIAPS